MSELEITVKGKHVTVTASFRNGDVGLEDQILPTVKLLVKAAMEDFFVKDLTSD